MVSGSWWKSGGLRLCSWSRSTRRGETGDRKGHSLFTGRRSEGWSGEVPKPQPELDQNQRYWQPARRRVTGRWKSRAGIREGGRVS